MDANELVPPTVPIPEEKSLVRRAKSGEADAFIQLFDAYGDDLYRYIYFRALSDVAAEAITSQVFRHAWDHLDGLPKKGKSFAGWLYDIARNQVIIYYSANLKSPAFNITALAAAADYRLDEATPDWSAMSAWGDHLRLLTGDIEQSRLQTTAALIMRRYLEYLNPGRVMRPSPTFNAYTRAWLIRYVQFHPRKPRRDLRREWSRLGHEALVRAQMAAAYRPLPAASLRRAGISAAMVMMMLLATGTARAQNALPGDPLYGLKRTTEQALLTVAPDHVGVELFLADRRLDEWMQVEYDPARRGNALDNYNEAIAQLNMAEDTQTLSRIVPVLQAHKKKLDASGIASPQLDTLLSVAANPAAGDVAALPPTSVPPSVTQAVFDALPTDASSGAVNGLMEPASATPTLAVPTATDTATATEVPPTATDTPTFTPTDTPTDTPTSTPTDVPPTATTTPSPTEIAPTDTPYPTDTPFPTATPTDVVPTATDAASAGGDAVAP